MKPFYELKVSFMSTERDILYQERSHLLQALLLCFLGVFILSCEYALLFFFFFSFS